MSRLSLDAAGGQWLADIYAWKHAENDDDSSDARMERLRRNLHLARQQVLTRRQQEILDLYYDQGLTMGQIALKLHINTSTVCRTLQRARMRLYQCLRYSL